MSTGFPTESTPMSLGDAAIQLSAGSEIVRLLALDDLWSQYLGAPVTEAVPDFPGLQMLASMIAQGIKEVSNAAGLVRLTLERQSEESVTEGLRTVRQLLADRGIFAWPFNEDLEVTASRELLLSACSYIQNESDAEQHHLAQKMDQLSREILPDPDLRPLFRCVLSLVGIASVSTLAVAGAIPTLGASLSVAIGVGAVAGTSALSWEQTGCGGRRVRSALASG